MLIKYVIDAEPAAPVIPHCGIKKYPEMQIATNPKNEEIMLKDGLPIPLK